MDTKFYEQAKRNILGQHKKELRDEIEYEASCLKYNSEKLLLTSEVKEELEFLTTKMKSLPIRCRWDDYAKNVYLAAIREIKKEGRYHPNRLEWLRSEERFRR